VLDAESEVSMWTAANRKSYERKGLRYPSDMTDAEWGLMKPLVDVPQRGQGRRRQVDLREVLNAVFYMDSPGPVLLRQKRYGFNNHLRNF
jgi:lipopolysaccharide/colanic/teichoic acid biosynthesis glycosyltransferase